MKVAVQVQSSTNSYGIFLVLVFYQLLLDSRPIIKTENMEFRSPVSGSLLCTRSELSAPKEQIFIREKGISLIHP